ncbi:MAG: helix-turn-helix domain-containing protein [Nitrospirota bacterium]|nr:helix-turn-helix domain-containing protein [Nitrospirota bacterium]
MDLMACNTALAVLEQMIEAASPAHCPALVGELEKLKALAWAKMMHGPNPPAIAQTLESGHYLTVGEVVERFHVTPKWLYRHKKQMPHSQPSRKLLLFPEKAIEKWFAGRKVS